MPHFYRLLAQKWIHYSDSVVILAVVQVFGIKGGATQFHSGRNDRGVPVRDLKPATDLHGGENQLEGDWQDRRRRGEFQHGVDVCFADPQLFLPQRIGDVFLQDLGGQRKWRRDHQRLGSLSFGFVRRCVGTGVEQHIRVQEDLSGHKFPHA